MKYVWNKIDIIMTIFVGLLALVLAYFIPWGFGNWAIFTAYRLFEVILASCGLALVFIGGKAWFARDEYDDLWKSSKSPEWRNLSGSVWRKRF